MQGNLQEDGTYRWMARKDHALGAAVKPATYGDFNIEGNEAPAISNPNPPKGNSN
jgi:hypothetical protein